MVELQPKKSGTSALLWQVPSYGFAALCIVRGIQAFADMPILGIPFGLAVIWMGLVSLPPVSGLFRDLPLHTHLLARAGIAVLPVIWVGMMIARTPLPSEGPAAGSNAPSSATALGSADRKSLATDDPEIRRILDDEGKKDDATRFAERIHSELLPRVAAVDTTEPTEITEVWIRVGELDSLAAQVAQGRALNLNPAQVSQLSRLEAALAAKQAVLFPRLRSAYRKGLKASMWEHDINVSGSGRMIEFVGSTFALNANIKATEEGLERDLIRLRFSVARYRWMRDGDGSQYRLDSPVDTVISG